MKHSPGRGDAFQGQQERVRRAEGEPLASDLWEEWRCNRPFLPLPRGLKPELLDLYTVNLHRIEKDVQRCDRNYWYFTPANLEKLRNIMCRWLRGGGLWARPGVADTGPREPSRTAASAAVSLPTCLCQATLTVR